MSNGEKRGGLWIDPRTKILLLLLCVLSATMAPSLLYEMLIVALVACFGIVCGKVRYSIIGDYCLWWLLSADTGGVADAVRQCAGNVDCFPGAGS